MAYSARKVELLIKTGTFSSSKRKGIRKGKTDCSMYRGVGAYQSVGLRNLKNVRVLCTQWEMENGKDKRKKLSIDSGMYRGVGAYQSVGLRNLKNVRVLCTQWEMENGKDKRKKLSTDSGK